MRSLEASARFLFPFGDTGIASRLRRLESNLLVLRGEDDQIIPESHMKLYDDQVPYTVKYEVVAGAGQLCELEKPEVVSLLVKEFFG